MAKLCRECQVELTAINTASWWSKVQQRSMRRNYCNACANAKKRQSEKVRRQTQRLLTADQFEKMQG